VLRVFDHSLCAAAKGSAKKCGTIIGRAWLIARPAVIVAAHVSEASRWTSTSWRRRSRCTTVCAERWRRFDARLGRIEAVIAATVLLLLLGEGSVVEVLKRLSGG
jgi:hypothetical protein